MSSSFVHPALGALVYDKGLNWYACSATANGERLDIYLSLDDCADEGALLQIAQERARRLDSLFQAAKQYAAASLLQEINAEWLVPTESPLSAEGLLGRLIARSLTLYPDGTQDIFLGPDQLFSGHCVIVSSDESGEFTEASVAG